MSSERERAENNVNHWETELRKVDVGSVEYTKCEERLNRAQDIYYAILTPSDLAATAITESVTPAGYEIKLQF